MLQILRPRAYRLSRGLWMKPDFCKMAPIKAVLLAAGKGTRMGELTASLPKPMVEVHGRPVLEWILEGLRDQGGLREFFIIVGFQGDVIRRHFEDGSRMGVSITYGEQPVQDGTGRAPELAREWVGADPFFLGYGDILIDAVDYRGLMQAWKPDGVIALKKGEDLSKGGAVVLGRDGCVTDIVEKGQGVPPENAYYNAGLYLLSPQIFEFTQRLTLSARGEYELTDALRAWAQAGGRLHGHFLERQWADVRDPEVLAQLNATK